MTIINAYRDIYKIPNHTFVFFDLKCDCGNIINHVDKNNFFRRKYFSCLECHKYSMSYNVNLENLIGKKYNKLTIANAYRAKRKSGMSEIRVDCLCDCGRQRDNITLSKVRDGIFYSCKFCAKSISSMEMLVHETLKKNNIDFIHQKKFSDCKDIFELPFDFYLPSLNILIECDGSQHFEKHHFNNSNTDFQKIQYHDQLKTEYANKNNIKLIRFNYKQTKDDIKNELLSIIGCENRKKY